jgi:hypothetical protein
VTTAAGLPPLPRRPIPTVRRSSLKRTMERYTSLPEVWAVELALSDGEVTRLVVHWETGRKTELTVTEDA